MNSHYVIIMSAIDVRRFVQEALEGHEAKEILRKTNILAKRKLGKGAVGYGWALEGVLAGRGASLEMGGKANGTVSS